jgi:branched-chain amino acid transport system substrate-binding protein
VAPPDTIQAKALANLIKADFPDAGGVRIDVVFEKSDYGDGFGQPLADDLIALGFVNSRLDFFPGDTNSQTMVINGLANDSPKATVLIAFPSDVRDLITRAKTFPSLTRAGGHRWYLTDATKDPAVLTPATLGELDQTIGTAPAQGAGGAFAAFRDSFRLRYGIDPNSFSYTSHSYDAMWLVMLASASAESAGGITGPHLGQGMGKLTSTTASIPVRADKWTEASNTLLQGLSINVEGASGPLDFDYDAGVPSAPYEVWQVSDGGIRVLRLTNP